MPSTGSVTTWIGKLKAGQPEAAQQLWQRYFVRLARFARKKLQGVPRRAADEEDVALSAFDSFCRQAERGRFPQLRDRDGLWRLLAVMTARKAAHMKRDAARMKRGGAAPAAAGDHDALLGEVPSSEPTPELAAEFAEECRRLLGSLRDPELEAVALRRLEGYSVEEIAAHLGYAPRSIKRKLQIIRGLWEKEIAP